MTFDLLDYMDIVGSIALVINLLYVHHVVVRRVKRLNKLKLNGHCQLIMLVNRLFGRKELSSFYKWGQVPITIVAIFLAYEQYMIGVIWLLVMVPLTFVKIMNQTSDGMKLA